MIYQAGEFLRLYAWIAMPVLLVTIFGWRMARNVAGLVSIAPLALVWLAGRAVVLTFGDYDVWAWNAGIDAISALAVSFLAVEIGPRKPLGIIACSFAIEVMLHCIYGAHLIADGYNLTAHRLYYWSTFAVALGQIVVAAKWGGSRGGKRRHGRILHSDHAGDSSRPVGVRYADILRVGRTGG